MRAAVRVPWSRATSAHRAISAQLDHRHDRIAAACTRGSKSAPNHVAADPRQILLEEGATR